jgi:hypothetical protein
MKDFIKKYIVVLVGLGVLAIPLVGVLVYPKDNNEVVVVENAELVALREKVRLAEEKITQKENLVKFIMTCMEMEPKSKVSMAKRQSIADKLADAVIKNLPNQDAREQYISMVKIESNFENNSKSPVGAVGIGQIMPSTFNGTIKKMNMGIKPEDITSEDVNLNVGAFYFNELLVEQQGNPRLASIAYNGGGRTANSFKKMNRINAESANYSLLTEHIKETVREKVIADDKAIADEVK